MSIVDRFRGVLPLALLMALATVLTVAGPASAHAPLRAKDNGTLRGATIIPDSSKSWAIYSDLAGGEAEYFRFRASKGKTIPISLFTSPSKRYAGFTPGFVVMGPGMSKKDSIPGFVRVPPGDGWKLFEGRQPASASYEAFSPSAFVQVAQTDFKLPADGDYYVAVFDVERGGRYGVAIGAKEEFTSYEWATIPLAVPAIYAWSGWSPWITYAPAFLVSVAGIGLLLRRRAQGKHMGLAVWMSAIAGLLFIGSGVTIAFQGAAALTVSEADALVAVTGFLASLPVVLGVLTLRLALLHPDGWTLRSRIYLAFLGLLAVVFWAGWLIGPALAVASAVLAPRDGPASEAG